MDPSTQGGGENGGLWGVLTSLGGLAAGVVTARSQAEAQAAQAAALDARNQASQAALTGNRLIDADTTRTAWRYAAFAAVGLAVAIVLIRKVK